MYCTIDNILEKMDEKLVARLSNDNESSKIDLNVVNGLIYDNTEKVNGYLRGRYPLPLQKDHRIIKRTTIELVKYDLYKRRDMVTDRMQENYKDLLLTLANIQKGVITLDEGTSEASSGISVAHTKTRGVFDNILKQYRNMQ